MTGKEKVDYASRELVALNQRYGVMKVTYIYHRHRKDYGIIEAIRRTKNELESQS